MKAVDRRNTRSMVKMNQEGISFDSREFVAVSSSSRLVKKRFVFILNSLERHCTN